MTVATPPATSHAPTAAGSPEAVRLTTAHRPLGAGPPPPPPAHAPPAAAPLEVAPLTIADRTFRSRLFLGTGKYPDFDVMSAALEASGTEVVTVALRRVNLGDRGAGSMFDRLDPERYLLLPNTAGCYTADEAIRTARLARERGGAGGVGQGGEGVGTRA